MGVVRMLVSALFVASIAATTTATSWADSTATIKIGTEGSWKPLSYQDAAGNLVGFEIDLAKSVCERSKVTCEFVVLPFDTLIPSLQEGKIDAIASGLRTTAKRKKIVDFVVPYYTMAPTFASCRHKDLQSNSPDVLKGMSVGVQVGSPHVDFLKTRYPGLDIKTYKTIDDIFADLKSQRLDLVYGGKPSAYDFLSSDRGAGCVFIGEPIVDGLYNDPTAIAVRKGDVETKKALDAGVAAVMADGSFDAINAKYWPFSIKYTGGSK